MTPSLLPDNSTALERDFEAMLTERLIALPDAITALWAIDECPSEHLPFVAWALSVDIWRSYWPDDVKRDVIRSAFEVHRTKGTRASVQRALNALNIRTVITEWFEPGGSGEPYTFRVRALAGRVLNAASETAIDEELIETVRCIIDATKPLRAHFDLEIGVATQMALAPVAVQRASQIVRSEACLNQGRIAPRLAARLACLVRSAQIVRREYCLQGAAA